MILPSKKKSIVKWVHYLWDTLYSCPEDDDYHTDLQVQFGAYVSGVDQKQLQRNLSHWHFEFELFCSQEYHHHIPILFFKYFSTAQEKKQSHHVYVSIQTPIAIYISFTPLGFSLFDYFCLSMLGETPIAMEKQCNGKVRI